MQFSVGNSKRKAQTYFWRGYFHSLQLHAINYEENLTYLAVHSEQYNCACNVFPTSQSQSQYAISQDFLAEDVTDCIVLYSFESLKCCE